MVKHVYDVASWIGHYFLASSPFEVFLFFICTCASTISNSFPATEVSPCVKHCLIIFKPLQMFDLC